MAPGQTIVTVHATDADSEEFSSISYHIPKAGNSAAARKLVKVNQLTGEVKLLKLLDREQFDG